MKYIVDIDALKDCLDLLETVRVNGHDYAALHNVKLLIDRFPKDQLEIPKLMRCGTLEMNCEATDAGNEKGE